MKAEEIRLIYAYNYWANHRILSACARVSEACFKAATGAGSLHATLIHLLDAERSWLLLLLGNPWPDDLTEADLPTLRHIEQRWQAVEQDVRAYIGGLSDDDLNGVVRYPIGGGIVRERVLWHCLLHVVNHGTQHRSEAALFLTDFGQSPGDMDFTMFLNEYFNLPS